MFPCTPLPKSQICEAIRAAEQSDWHIQIDNIGFILNHQLAEGSNLSGAHIKGQALC